MASAIILPPPPYQSPIADKSGVLTPLWSKWFQQLNQRVGGLAAVSNISLSQNSVSSALFTTYAGSSQTTVYASPTGQNTVIDSFEAKNIGFVAQTLSVYLVPVGSTPSSSNIVVVTTIIPASSSVELSAIDNQVLGGGWYISCVASSGGQVLVSASGRQVS